MGVQRTAHIALITLGGLGLAAATGCGPSSGSPSKPVGVYALEGPIVVKRKTIGVHAIGPYEPGTLRVVGTLQGDVTTIDVVDGRGNPLPKLHDRTGPVESGTAIYFEVSPKPGQGERVRIAGGAREDAVLNLQFEHVGRPALVVSFNDGRYGVGSAVSVFAKLQDGTSAAVRDFSGTVTADLRGAQKATIKLADEGQGADAAAGDGTFSGTLPPINAQGAYSVSVYLDGKSAAYGAMRRRSATDLVVTAQMR